MKDEEAGKEKTGDATVEEKGEASEEKNTEYPNEEITSSDENGDIPVQPNVFDDDEKALFEKLMKKIQNAGDLDKELESDFSSFEERVESVVDSIERIENLERASMEKLVYKQVEKEEGPGPDAEPTPEPSEEKLPTVEEVPDEPNEIPQQEDEDIGIGQIYIPTETPYDQIKKGEITFDYKGDFLDAYGSQVETVLRKMFKLIQIKIDKDELDRAKDLFLVSANLGGGSKLFQKDFLPLAKKLGIEVPKNKYLHDEEGIQPTKISIDEMEDTEVLDPDLADEINILQKKATSAIKQLETLLGSSDLPEEEVSKINTQFETAMELFRNKMFHKAYEVALEALGVIKNKVQDSIDNKLQTDLYRTKEILEEYSTSEGADKPEQIEELKTTFDRAMKAYLTNEFEKANLLTKKVHNTLLDLLGESRGPMKEKAEDLKKELRELKEINVPSQNIDDVLDVLKSAENFIDRRDITNAEKLIERIESSIVEIREKSNKYMTAKEMEIKITNRVERLKGTISDLDLILKKLDFIHNYFKQERYDDVLTIGSEISQDLDSLEEIKKETESRDILDKLETLMERIEKLDEPEKYQQLYKDVIQAYTDNDMGKFKTLGNELLEELTQRFKTIGVERAKVVAGQIIEARILVSKLMALNIDTIDMERKIRKSKNLLKEGNHKKGITKLSETIDDMKKAYIDHLEYLKDYMNIYRDSLEVVMDRHKEEPIVYHLKRKQVPILRKMAEIGNYHKALENYKILESKLTEVVTTEEKKESVEEELNEIKFEIYKRKEEGLDISEPLSLYTLAQKRYGDGYIVPAEYLIEVSKRYCEGFMPI